MNRSALLVGLSALAVSWLVVSGVAAQPLDPAGAEALPADPEPTDVDEPLADEELEPREETAEDEAGDDAVPTEASEPAALTTDVDALGDEEGGDASASGPVLDLPDEPLDGEHAADDDEDVDYPSLTWGGYGETEFHTDFRGNSFFDHHRLVLFLNAQILDFIRFSSEIEWEHGGTPRKVDGSLDVGEVLLEYAVLDVTITEWLNLRAGIVLVPFGSFNVNHDAPSRDLGVRPMAITYIVPSTWFETGAGFFGTFGLPGDMELSYQAYLINGLDTKMYDGIGMRAARGSLGEDNNDNKALVAHVSYVPTNGIEIGTSLYFGAYDPSSERFVTMVGTDFALRAGPVEVLGELIYSNADPGFDEGWPDASRQAVPEQMLGFFGQVNVHFMPAFLREEMSGRMREEATFTASLRYGEVNTDLNTTSAGDRSRLTIGLNFRPIEAVVFKEELLFQANGGSGSHDRIWSGNWDPSTRFVSSVAFLY